MGTTLQNGVYLPNEGERNCYAGLKTNWEILDQKVADVTALQQAVAGALHREIVESLPTTDIDPNTIYMILSGTSATENVYNEFMYVNNAWELIGTSATDLTNYYTKAEVDGKLLLKANASDLTSHTGDTTIHVTTADKTKWNNGVSQSYVFRYSGTAITDNSTIAYSTIDNTDNIKSGDKILDVDGKLFEITAVDTTNQTVTVGSALIDLALDANVMHLSGNETVNGNKNFVNNIIAKKIISNVSQLQINAKTNADSIAMIGGNSASDGGGVWVYGKNSSYKSIVTLQVYDTDNSVYHAVRLNMDGSLTPTVSNNGLGSSSYKWVSFNGVEPSSLSLPSGNLNDVIDISSYLVNLDGTLNTYTAPANGWILITMSNSSGIQAFIIGLWGHQVVRPSAGAVRFLMPILKNLTANIAISGGTIDNARFIPCQGNV